MKNGFTLIEIMIVIAIIGILVSVFIPVIQGKKYEETFCRGGYVFDRMSGKQILGENGGGVKCDVNVPQP